MWEYIDVLVEEDSTALRPGRPLITWAKGFLTQPTLLVRDGPSTCRSVSDSVRKDYLPPFRRAEDGMVLSAIGTYGHQDTPKRDVHW